MRTVRKPVGLTDAELARLDSVIRMTRAVRRGHSLYRAGDGFESIYAVRVGSFKTVVMHRDGREHVTGFSSQQERSLRLFATPSDGAAEPLVRVGGVPDAALRWSEVMRGRAGQHPECLVGLRRRREHRSGSTPPQHRAQTIPCESRHGIDRPWVEWRARKLAADVCPGILIVDGR